MAIDKSVDSTLLDAAMSYEAGKIRAKLGSSAQISYDLANGKGFGDAIDAIPTGGSLNYKTGTFVLAADTNARDISDAIKIQHGLGAVPSFVMVWTEDYDTENPPSAALMGGFVWIKDLFNDFPERLTSSVSSSYNTYSPFVITAAGTINTTVGSSTTYFPGSDRSPTSEYFVLPCQGNSTYWRAGVTYKFFVAEAWWGA